MLALAFIVVATGAPLTEIHAHDDAADASLSSLEHGDGHHGQDPQDDDLHVHDIGLFGHAVGAAGMAPPPFHADAIAVRFPERTEPAPQAHLSQLFRPPTRA